MEVPRLGVESELQLPVYTTATATRDPRCICRRHHSSRQCHWIPISTLFCKGPGAKSFRLCRQPLHSATARTYVRGPGSDPMKLDLHNPAAAGFGPCAMGLPALFFGKNGSLVCACKSVCSLACPCQVLVYVTRPCSRKAALPQPLIPLGSLGGRQRRGNGHGPHPAGGGFTFDLLSPGRPRLHRPPGHGLPSREPGRRPQDTAARGASSV